MNEFKDILNVDCGVDWLSELRVFGDADRLVEIHQSMTGQDVALILIRPANIPELVDALNDKYMAWKRENTTFRREVPTDGEA